MHALTRRTNRDLSLFDEIFSNFWGRPVGIMRPVSPIHMDEGNLALDVSEKDSEVIVRATLPGFKKEDVHVQLEDGVLTIKAEYKQEKVEKSEEGDEPDERFYRRERKVGSLTRRISLPTRVTDSEAKAELKEGILTLSFPKLREVTARKIDIL